MKNPGNIVSTKIIVDGLSKTYNFRSDDILTFLIPIRMSLEEVFAQAVEFLCGFTNPLDCEIVEITFLICVLYSAAQRVL